MSIDPFGTAGLRAAVLAAWVAHPARFREDANAEEDHGRGYYRDRVVVELAQNAADAAVRAGVPGRLVLRLTTTASGGTLVAANTGALLDAAGVASLASLRASAKRSAAGPTPEGHAAAAPTVGRFGVGFAAVRSVADEVVVASTSGAVHFSLERTAELLARDVPPDLTAEVTRRHGSLPALRLPFAGDGPADLLTGDWDTAVVLTLRDLPAVELVRSQLDAVGDALLLALPGLAAVEVDVDGRSREVRDVNERWVVATRSGNLDPRLLADRPVEERDRTGWQVTWAVPRRGTTAEHPAVVHAPTPTDEPCTVPALLVATFPLDPSRRHVAPGPLTDVLVARAGEVWAELLSACRDEQGPDLGSAVDRTGPGTAPHPLDLIVGGRPAGALDSALREVVVETSRHVPVFSPADGGPALTAGEVVVLDGPAGRDPAVLRVLGGWLPGLVEVASRHRHLVRLLDLATTELGDVVDALPTTEPDRLLALYEAFAAADSSMLEQLATLPVLLADGRTVRGARGLVLLDEDVDPATVRSLTRWGLRVVEPRAAHPLLERLGATRADAAALLHHPVLRERVLGGDANDDLADVDDLGDGDDLAVRRDGGGGSHRTDPAAQVVLGLVRAVLQTGASLEPEPWFGEVLLSAADGELVPASGLVLPGSPAAHWFDPEALPPIDASLVERWGTALEVVGVCSGLRVVRVRAGDDEPAAGSEDDGLLSDALDGWDEYLDLLGPDVATGTELRAVADLDAVRGDAWPAVLHALVAGEPRRALVEPVRLPDGGAVPSYTAWWLRRRGRLGLDRPFALPDAAGLGDGPRAGRRAVAALLGEAPAVVAGLDAEVLGVLGGVADAADLDEAGWADVLYALPVVAEPVDVALAVEIWRGLARRAVRDPGFTIDLERVSVLPALVDDGHGHPKTVVVPADEVAVATPMWAQHLRAGPLVVVPPSAASAMADALDADLATDREAGAVTSVGNVVPTPEAIGAVYPAAPATWVEHEDLLVDGEPVDWWVVEPEVPGGSATVHAATTDGLVRGLAHVLGPWHAASIERLLTDPASAPAVLLDLAGQEEP